MGDPLRPPLLTFIFLPLEEWGGFIQDISSMSDIEVRVRVTMLGSRTSRFAEGKIGGSFTLPSVFTFR